MASEILKINEATMEAQVTKIKEAVNNYKQFAEKPFSDEIEYLDDMNTDFIAKFKVMLGDLDDDNSKVVAALEEIAGLTEEILKTFQKVDDDAVATMGFSREG